MDEILDEVERKIAKEDVKNGMVSLRIERKSDFKYLTVKLEDKDVITFTANEFGQVFAVWHNHPGVSIGGDTSK